VGYLHWMEMEGWMEGIKRNLVNEPRDWEIGGLEGRIAMIMAFFVGKDGKMDWIGGL
jgi:hypothetical protein